MAYLAILKDIGAWALLIALVIALAGVIVMIIGKIAVKDAKSKSRELFDGIANAVLMSGRRKQGKQGYSYMEEFDETGWGKKYRVSRKKMDYFHELYFNQ